MPRSSNPAVCVSNECSVTGFGNVAGILNVAEVCVDVFVELNLALLVQLHHGRCGEQLRHRRDLKQRGIGIDARLCFEVGESVTALQNDAAVLDEHEHRARNVPRFHGSGEEAVEEVLHRDDVDRIRGRRRDRGVVSAGTSALRLASTARCGAFVFGGYRRLGVRDRLDNTRCNARRCSVFCVRRTRARHVIAAHSEASSRIDFVMSCPCSSRCCGGVAKDARVVADGPVVPREREYPHRHVGDCRSAEDACVTRERRPISANGINSTTSRSNDNTSGGVGLPSALKHALATPITPMKPRLIGTMSRYIVAVSTTSGSSLIMPTSQRAATAMTRNDATPQTRQKPLHSANALRTRSNRCAPQFWPTNGPTDVDTAMTTIAMTASIRDATAKPATTPWPKSASRRVTIPVDSGATRFDAVAGRSHVQNLPRRVQPACHARHKHSFLHGDPVHAQRETDQPGDHERPRRAHDAERGQPGPTEYQERRDQYLQQRTDGHHDAGHGRIAGRAQQIGADHRRCEEDESDEPDCDVGVRQFQHAALRAQQHEEGARPRHADCRRITRRMLRPESDNAS